MLLLLTTAMTLMMGHVTALQASGVATLTLPDRSSYSYPSASVSATPTTTLAGQVIVVEERTAPDPYFVSEYGWDVHLSPDLMKQIDAAANQSCKGDDYNKCYHEVNALISSPNTDLQVRQLTLIALGGALIATQLAYLLSGNPNTNNIRPLDVHIPPAQISQASSAFASSYSLVALASSSGTPFATITPGPSTTVSTAAILNTPAAVTTQAADSSANKKGDIVFTITESQAMRWQEIIARGNTSRCALATEQPRNIASRQAQDSLMSNVLCASEILLANMLADGAAEGLSHALPLRFNWRDDGTNEAMHVVQAYARQYASDMGLDVPVADRYGIAAFAVTREVIINNNTLVGDGTTPSPLFIPASDIDLDHPPASSCEMATRTVSLAACRMIGALQACTTTATSSLTCDDATTTSGLPVSKAKRVILTTEMVAWTISDEDPYGEASTTAAVATPSKTSTGVSVDQGDLKCGNATDLGNPQRFMDPDMMNKAAEFFCNWQVVAHTVLAPGKLTESQKHLELNYNDHIGDPIYVSADWIDNPACPSLDFTKDDAKDTCMQRLGTVINGCDTKNDANYYYWKQGGSFFRDCISWGMRRDNWVTSGFDSSPVPDTDPTWRDWTHTCTWDSDCTGDPNITDFCDSRTGDYNTMMCLLMPSRTTLGWCFCRSISGNPIPT